MNMTDYRASLYHRVLRWREEHISEKRFILILSFLVGIFTALAAWVLKWIIHLIETFLTENFDVTQANGL